MSVLIDREFKTVTQLAQRALGELSSPIAEVAVGAQGASGAQVRYFQAGEQRFIAKHATLLERRIMNLLQDQGQAVPRVAAGLDADSRDWMVMEFAEEIPDESNEDPAWTKGLGIALAGIHAVNMGKKREWLQLVSTDNELSDIHCNEWQPLYQGLVKTDPVFASLHGDKVGALDSSWEDFKAELCREMEDGTRLTLISTDHIPGHWRQVGSKPVLIDWEQSRFGPLYLDLPNLFNEKTVGAYYKALASRGVDISPAEFSEKFVSLSRYLV